MKGLAGAALALVLAACGTRPGPAPAPLDAGLAADQRFHAAAPEAPAAGADDLAWWHRFDDPALARWIERALAQNLGLALGRSEVDEARALLRVAQAGRRPAWAGEARVDARTRRSTDGRRLEPALALAFDWDADLWGGLLATERAAAAELQRREQLALAARLQTAALTARAYLAWREATLEREQLDAARALLHDIARVVQLRVDAGLAPVFDGQRARSELAAADAERVAAATRVRAAERALQLLAGARPGAPLPAADAPLPRLQRAAPVTLPVDLLRRRPDLRAAEAAWHAAVAEYDAAGAARRPALRLPGALTLGTASSGALLAELSASVAASLTAPLFDAGRGEALQDAARARVEAAALAYRQQVQQALAQVEAALQGTADSALRLQAQQQAAREAEAAVGQARTLYTAGLAGLLDLLDAQRSALERQLALLRTEGDAARAAVATFEALGLIDAPSG